MKKRILLYLVALLFAVISALSIPTVLRVLCCLVPLAFYGYSTVLEYLKRLKEKSFFNEYLIALIAALAELISLKFVYAAMTLIFFDAVVFFFKTINAATIKRVENASGISVAKATILANGKAVTVPVSRIAPGNTVLLKEGDVIPVDGVINNGDALIDYSNIFGSGDFVQATPSSFCYSGGILQTGELYISCTNSFADSYAANLLAKTKAAHRPSALHKKVLSLKPIITIAFILIAVITFIVSLIATHSFSQSINYFSVLLVLSSTFPLLYSCSTLYHNTIIDLRMRGITVRSEQTIDSLTSIESISSSNEIDSNLRNLLEAEGIVMGDNAPDQKLAFLYRNRENLISTQNHCFKVALGFFDKKADLTVNDGAPRRILDAIKGSKTFKTFFIENMAVLIIEKVLVLLLLFIFNIHATDAMILEFAAAVVCCLNSAKYFS